MALAMGGVKFTENILSFEEFKSRKDAGEFQFGTLPVLTLEDGRCACAFLKVHI